MDELLAWLKPQNEGVGTYIDFQQRALQLASEHRENAALFQLLSSLSGRFATSYDGMPLPVDVASPAFVRLTGLVEKAAKMVKSPADAQLRFLNEIAQADLG
jgi:hypothetical protein